MFRYLVCYYYYFKCFIVSLLVPARITAPPDDVIANVGQTFVRFLCEAEGIPKPTLSWRRESEIIEASGRISLSGNQLVITNAELLDSGTYTCIASNAAGSDTASAELNVLGKHLFLFLNSHCVGSCDFYCLLKCNHYRSTELACCSSCCLVKS